MVNTESIIVFTLYPLTMSKFRDCRQWPPQLVSPLSCLITFYRISTSLLHGNGNPTLASIHSHHNIVLPIAQISIYNTNVFILQHSNSFVLEEYVEKYSLALFPNH